MEIFCEEKIERSTFDNNTVPKDSQNVSQKEDTTTSSPDYDTLTFLKKIKLEPYYGILISQGAERLGHLIYLEDQSLDLLIRSCKMSIVHAGVFKKAIMQCRPTVTTSEESTTEDKRCDRSSRCCHSCQPNHNHGCCGDFHHNGFGHKRRYSPPGFYPYTQNIPTNYNYQMDPLQQHLANRYPQNYYNDQIQNSQRNEEMIQIPPMSAIQRSEPDRLVPPSKEVKATQPTNSTEFENSMNSGMDGSYYPVKVGNRLVRFPPSVRQLTYYESIDTDRKDIVRKGSQIFGRDDTKRKTSELTALETLMNEIAYEVCMRDFTFIMSRQRLLALVREIVKDNQIQLPNHISTNSANSSGSLDYSQMRSRNFDSKVRNNSGEIFTNGTYSMPSEVNGSIESGENGSPNDYEIILYHKINREWPPGTSKEKKKYLGRRSSNFEVSNGELYYIKDGKCRKWLPRDEDVYKCFLERHIDKESSEHFSKEKTFESIVPYFYTKNLNEILTRIYNSCEICRSRYLPSSQNPYGTRSTSLLGSGLNEEMTNNPCIGGDRMDSLSKENMVGQSDTLKRMIVVKTLQAQVEKLKQPRKSVPHRYQRLPDDEDISLNCTSHHMEVVDLPNEFSTLTKDVTKECEQHEELSVPLQEAQQEDAASQTQLSGMSQSFAV